MLDKIPEHTLVTVVCEGGWKYTGRVVKTLVSISGNLLWIKIETKSGIIAIHSKYIVSIITPYGKF